MKGTAQPCRCWHEIDTASAAGGILLIDKTAPNETPAEINAGSEELVSAFRSDGYAIANGILSEEYCDELGTHFDNDCFGLRELLTMGAIQKMARSPHVLRIARAILGDRVFAVSGTFFNKTGSANWKVPWHQDRMIKVRERFDAYGWGPWSTKGDVIHVQPPASVIARVLTIRLHLDDCPPENGALRVIPGSHQFGFLDPERTTRLLGQTGLTCPVPKGGAFLMSPLLLHSSSPSKSPLPHSRRVVHLEFAADELPEPFRWRYRVA